MKLKKLAGFALLAMAIGAANATIYLVKDGKVVARYEDEAVDQITFEDPTEYDVVTESILSEQAYYGDALSDLGYNYYLFLADMEPNDKGGMPINSMQYSIRLQTPEMKEGEINLPAGIYRLGKGNAEPGMVNPQSSSMMYMGGRHVFADILMNVAYDNKEMVIDITATDTEGMTFKTHYQGEPYVVDQTLKWLDNDVELSGGTLTATYLKQETGFDMNCNMNITISENGYDENGWMQTPGHLMILVGNVKLTKDGKFEPCTWNIIDGDVAQENTLLAGKAVNFLNAPFPVNSTIKYYKDQQDITVGLLKEGSVTIMELSPGMYRLSYNFTTEQGKSVSGRYVGRIEIKNLPEPEETWHLDGDYQLNLEQANVTCTKYSWSKDIQLDIDFLNQYYSYNGDRVQLQIKTIDGFKPGIYSVKDTGVDIVGTITPGQYFGTWGTGSVFYIYDDAISTDPIKGTGITDGTCEVIENGDGTYTINLNLVDDQPAGNKITGTWTGEITIKEF